MSDLLDTFDMSEEEADAILRQYGYDPEQVGKTGARLAEAWLEAQRQKMRAEAAEQWQTQVPWSALRMVLDAAYQFAEGNAELWADCELVQTWVDDHEIGDESCATLHPETWEGTLP